MSNPAAVDMTVDRRVAVAEKYSFLDLDFTGSTFKMEVRTVKDTTTTPLLADSGGVTLAYAGSATVSAHISAGRLTTEIYKLTNPATNALYVSTDTVLLSQISISITASSIAGLPFPEQLGLGDRGDDLVVWYDIIRIPGSGANLVVMRGQFIVRAGVTIP